MKGQVTQIFLEFKNSLLISIGHMMETLKELIRNNDKLSDVLFVI
jgi:hypothetical protein